MSVTSEVGQGSAFTFTARLATGDQPALDRAPPAGLSGQRALIASANATSRAVLERWLTGWGMAPTAVADGTEALSALRAATAAGRPYAVALVDARMAEMGGPALAAMPIVLLVSADRSASPAWSPAFGRRRARAETGAAGRALRGPPRCGRCARGPHGAGADLAADGDTYAARSGGGR